VPHKGTGDAGRSAGCIQAELYRSFQERSKSHSSQGRRGPFQELDHAPPAATITAFTDRTLAAIDEKRFIFLTQQAPTFALNVMGMLGQCLRRMDLLVGGYGLTAFCAAPWGRERVLHPALGKL
jgi:hypothetical protein